MEQKQTARREAMHALHSRMLALASEACATSTPQEEPEADSETDAAAEARDAIVFTRYILSKTREAHQQIHNRDMPVIGLADHRCGAVVSVLGP